MYVRVVLDGDVKNATVLEDLGCTIYQGTYHLCKKIPKHMTKR